MLCVLTRTAHDPNIFSMTTVIDPNAVVVATKNTCFVASTSQLVKMDGHACRTFPEITGGFNYGIRSVDLM